MDYDKDRVDQMVLALLFLTSTHNQYGCRAWKSIDWETMDRLFQKGYISDPNEKAPTVVLSETGEKLSRDLFYRYFGTRE